MTIVVNKSNFGDLKNLLQSQKVTLKKGNLKKHFGKLKRGLDGLNFQRELRKNED